MVRIRKRVVGDKEYYYIEHTMRINGKVEKKEKYIGKQIPRSIEKIKNGFMNEIYNKRWFKEFERIKSLFAKEYGRMPRVAKEKYNKNFMIKFTYNSNRIEC